MKKLSSIKKELALAGAPRRILHSGEAKALTDILSEDEEILACVQGLYDQGIGLAVGTNARLLIINKSFFWMRMEDEPYVMVNSIVYKKGLFFGRLTLATRARRYNFTVLKQDPIELFVAFIDSKMRSTQSDPGHYSAS